jgi:thiol-disulfide isomerase/thioredoxin
MAVRDRSFFSAYNAAQENRMNAPYFADKFAAALAYDAYLQTGTDEQRRRWKQVYDAAALADVQKNLVGGFVREMKILIISGIWCGDCVQQCPLIQRIAEANAGKIDLRLVDRDQHRDLAEAFRLNAGDRVPVAIFLAEDFEFCGSFGDRTINRYRAIALRQLGPSCPTGIVGPDKEELNAMLGDWLNEIERVQLMLRISPRLRQKHND